jgi:2-keto-3-deoxy-L-rhamnonate aldolase RhmA
MIAVPEICPMINGFKRAIAARKPQLGIWSSLTSNLLAEILGDAGFDWILFDTEHAPNDLQQLIGQLQAIRGTSVHAMVRPAANDPVLIKRVLDIGFRNVLVPFVQTAEDAALAVTATRYPPKGTRGVSAYQRNNGYGRIKSYFEQIDDNITVAVQIETKEAITNLQSIAATPGVDAIFVGPGDLAASFGHLGQIRHADVQNAIRSIGEKATAAGVPAGIVAGNAEDAERYLTWGFTFMTVGSDIALFRDAVEQASKSIRNLVQPRVDTTVWPAPAER